MTDMIDRLNTALSNRYRIEHKLGEGGMASVYLAQDIRHDRQVALKVLKPELAAVMGAERFLSEIRTTASLQHPHILPLFDSGEADGLLFYVMPYIEGESLRERLDREKQLPVDEAVAITAKVAGALQVAHERGIVHRDIKPANILLANGEPLVADFGIALAVQEAGGGRLTETGLSLGTPFYMSPEQATGDRDPDARSDLYALGCVLYEMLAGEPPFTGGTAQAVLGRILTSETPSVTAVRKSVPANVDAVVQRALEKTPADRFPSASEFIRALADTRFGTGAQAVAVGRGAGLAGAGSEGPGSGVARLVPWVVAAAAIAVAVAASLGGDGPGAGSVLEGPVRFALAETGPAGLRASSQAAVSDDGSEIVFVADDGGSRQLYRRSLATGEVTPIPGTDDALFPVFSPDGTEVAFTDRDSRVWVMGVDGGLREQWTEAPDYPIGIAWGPDRSLIFGMLSYNGDYPGLSGMSEAGSELDVITDLVTSNAEGDGFAMHHEPIRIPGRNEYLFTDFGGNRFNGRKIGWYSADTGDSRILEMDGPALLIDAIAGVTDDLLVFLDQENLLWAVGWDPDDRQLVGRPVQVRNVPDGTRFARMAPNGTLVLVQRPDAFDVAIVDDRGNELEVLEEGPLNVAVPAYSPDGARIAVAANGIQNRRDLWIYDRASLVRSQLGMGEAPGHVVWTADGQSVLTTSSNFRISDQIRTRPADASIPGEVAFSLGNLVVAGINVSPDGRYAAVTVDDEDLGFRNRQDILIVDLTNPGEVEPFAASGYSELAPDFSPDGRWLAYASNESGFYQVYVRPFPGPGPRIQISDGEAGQPVWSSDGRRIFYVSDGFLNVAELDVTQETIRTLDRRRLFPLDDPWGVAADHPIYDVHPERDEFVVVRNLSPDRGRVVVWINWLDEVRQALAQQ